MPSIRQTIRQTIAYAALAATLAGTAGLAHAAPRSADPFTDGARVGARDVYTDGARAVHDTRSPFVDGAFSATGPRDAFDSGA
ncbi:hypothetical protein D3C87_1396720 [compost metagenome]|uniref:Copper resistance protein CopQ n=1 Tax=Cupriavidus campinensis TaxID=151783 RepID=A0AAE9I9Y0_9BURK|nr:MULTISPECIES: copper resistance protein CopQ [Cupriavidus]TSP13576.1 copper resistance protein CopQ [Cupriavidus campinensis]URF07945.1 copper resistance protein CopQ [Cupriavidus campinensis]CAG2150513.1 hypothetical protein LMG19282_03784 [Cupriavidus campinensis]